MMLLYGWFSFKQSIAQNSDIFNFSNSWNYANHLLRSGQYQLAQQELERIVFLAPENDSVRLLLIKSYRLGENYNKGILRAEQLFPELQNLPPLIIKEYACLCLSNGSFEKLNLLLEKNMPAASPQKSFLLLNSYLFRLKRDDAVKLYYSPADSLREHYPHYSSLLAKVAGTKYKSPELATALSIAIPGLGKVYTRNWVDGLLSFVTFSTLAWQSYRGFEKNGTGSVYGWVLGFFSVGFYSGNIYGTYKSAKLYNADINKHLLDETKHLFRESLL